MKNNSYLNRLKSIILDIREEDKHFFIRYIEKFESDDFSISKSKNRLKTLKDIYYNFNCDLRICEEKFNSYYNLKSRKDRLLIRYGENRITDYNEYILEKLRDESQFQRVDIL